jgi:hypothetical protein
VQLLGEVLLDGERGHCHRGDPGELKQVRGHDRVGRDDWWLAEADVDRDAFELASCKLSANSPALAAAGQIVIGGGTLHGEREEIVHLVGRGVQQQLDRFLLPQRPVDVDVLGRSCLPAEPQLEREPTFEKPAVGRHHLQAGEEPLEDDALPQPGDADALGLLVVQARL